MQLSYRVFVQAAVVLGGVSSILLARPAAAQYGTLNLASGDIVTVTGAGTVSNRAGGTNGTSTYDAGDNFYGVDAEAGSTFNLAGGAIIGEDGDSAIYSSGAKITISSGSVSSSGSGTDGLDARFGSTVTISGGSFTALGTGANIASPQASLRETPNATPGAPLSAVDLYADSSSSVTVTGGIFTASASAGTVGFYAINNGSINLFGTGFVANGVAVTGPITSGSGTLSGTLLNGNTFNSIPYVVSGGTIQFTPTPAAAPEPSAWAGLLVGALGLSLLGLRAYKRRLDDAFGEPA